MEKNNTMRLDIDKQVKYILGLEEKTKNSDALYFTDHKRLSGVYWAVCTLAIMDRLDSLPRERILKYILSCYHGPSTTRDDDDDGDDINSFVGFSGNTGQDVHLLYTLSGVQLLALYDALHLVDGDAIAESVRRLQNTDGSFCGDGWGEIDTRFTYCALLTLTILGRVDVVDLAAAERYVLSCQNFDGGFGCIAGAESHAGQVFCCVGALTLAEAARKGGGRKEEKDEEGEEEDGKRENEKDGEERGRTGSAVARALRGECGDRLSFWLCERQLPCGGFNGRPDKLEDVCYSWWVLASLAMLGRMEFVDGGSLAQFIAQCADDGSDGGDGGGFADRPGDMPDVFHTFFGVGALSLLRADDRLLEIDAAFALPRSVVRRLRCGDGPPR